LAQSAQSYRLFLADLEIAGLVEEDADFPNLFGRLSPLPLDSGHPLAARVEEFLTYSRTANEVMSAEGEAAWLKYAEAHESEFTDLIESEEWCLVDGQGRRLYILVPNVLADGGIVWRWNPSR